MASLVRSRKYLEELEWTNFRIHYSPFSNADVGTQQTQVKTSSLTKAYHLHLRFSMLDIGNYNLFDWHRYIGSLRSLSQYFLDPMQDLKVSCHICKSESSSIAFLVLKLVPPQRVIFYPQIVMLPQTSAFRSPMLGALQALSASNYLLGLWKSKQGVGSTLSLCWQQLLLPCRSLRMLFKKLGSSLQMLRISHQPWALTRKHCTLFKFQISMSCILVRELRNYNFLPRKSLFQAVRQFTACILEQLLSW